MAHARGVVCLAAGAVRGARHGARAGGGEARGRLQRRRVKAQVQHAIGRLLNLAEPPHPSHVADALALAWTGSRGSDGAGRAGEVQGPRPDAREPASSMIATLRGHLRRKHEDRVVLECGGIGYEVFLPPIALRQLEGAEVGEKAPELELVIYYHATRDQPRPVLIGFTSDLDKEFFEKLITVKDIGPMVAARALAAPVAELAAGHRASGREVPARAARASGPQKAKNIVAQLQNKVAKFALARDGAATLPAPAPAIPRIADGLREMVWEVLVKQLGHRPSEASQMIADALRRRPDLMSAEDLFNEIYRGNAGEHAPVSGRRAGAGAEPDGDARRSAVRAPAPPALVRGVRRPGPGGGQPARLRRGRAPARASASTTCCSTGRPGLGKTTLAGILANEMSTSLVTTSGPAVERGGDLMGILTNLSDGDVLFIDEIHRLARVVEELLYPAMEDFAVNLVMDKGIHARSIKHRLNRFTLVGATTRPGMLSAPLRERFGIFHHLDFYSEPDLIRIVTRSASILGAPLDRARRRRDRAALARHPAHREPAPAARARLRAGEGGRDRSPRAWRARRSISKAWTRAASTASIAGSSSRSSSTTAAGRSASRRWPRRSTTTARRCRRWWSRTCSRSASSSARRRAGASTRDAYAHLGKQPPASAPGQVGLFE